MFLSGSQNNKYLDQIEQSSSNQNDENVLYITNETFNPKTLKQKLSNINKNTIIFKKCSFDNVAKCIKGIIVNRAKFPKIHNIKFINCLPINDFQIQQPYEGNNLNITFIENINEILKFYEPQQPILTFKKKGYIGFSVKYKNLATMFTMKMMNFLALGTSFTNLQNFMSGYIAQQMPETKIPILPEINKYILDYFKISYFKEFYLNLQKELENNDVISYKICIFNTNDQLEMFMRLIQNDKKRQTIIMLMTIEGLFFNLSTMLLRMKEKYVYTGVINPYKKDIQKYVEQFLKNEVSENINKIIVQKKCIGFLTKINNRDVFIYDVKKNKTKDILIKMASIKEKNIYALYENLGIDYVICKLKEAGYSNQKAIQTVIKKFIQYLFITKTR